MTKPKPITAYAIVKKKTNKLSAYDIFKDKPIVSKDELLLKVKIEVTK